MYLDKVLNLVGLGSNLEEALKKAGIQGSVSLDNKIVKVDDQDVKKAMDVISKAGYTPTI